MQRAVMPRMIAAAAAVVLAAGRRRVSTGSRGRRRRRKSTIRYGGDRRFQNRTGDPHFDRTLEPMLKLALEGAELHQRVRPERVSRDASACSAAGDARRSARARKLAVKQGLGVVLSGSIAPQGNGYEISVKATQPVTGEVDRDARSARVEQGPGAGDSHPAGRRASARRSATRRRSRRRCSRWGRCRPPRSTWSSHYAAAHGSAVEQQVRGGAAAAMPEGREAGSEIRPRLPGPGRASQQSRPAAGRREVHQARRSDTSTA